MRGFVRAGGPRNLYTQAISQIDGDLRRLRTPAATVDFYGVSRDDADRPPERIDQGTWAQYAATSACRPKDERQPVECRSVYYGYGRLAETVRSLDRGGQTGFQVERGDVVVIITDLQLDSVRPSDPGPLGGALSDLVSKGWTVGIVGALSGFTGIIFDLPEARAEDRNRVLNNARQPFFFVVIGPNRQVERTVQHIEKMLRRDAAENDVGSSLFALAQTSPLDGLRPSITVDPQAAEPAQGFFRSQSPPERDVADGKLPAFRIRKARIAGSGSHAHLATAHIEAPQLQRSGTALQLRLGDPPDRAGPRLWAMYPRALGDQDCSAHWEPLENMVRHRLPPDRPASAVIEARRDGGALSLPVDVLYYVEQRLLVTATLEHQSPDWAKRWHLPFGQVDRYMRLLSTAPGGRDYLGVGNLTSLIELLTQAQVSQTFNTREVTLRLAFRLVE